MASILLYCQPGASETELVGAHDGKPKIRLKAPPVDGAANKALITFLAERCGVPRSAIRIESGMRGRIKRVAVDGLSDEELRERIGRGNGADA
jgi:uncharacterized protein (TIGR00251 family)